MYISLAVIPLISGIFILLFGIFVFFRHCKRMPNFLFFLFCVTVFTWLFGTYKMFSAQTEVDIIFWDRFIYIGVIFIPIFLYHFGLLYLNILSSAQRKILTHGYIFGLFFLVLSQTRYFVDGVFHYKWGVHTIAGPAHHLFLVFFFFYFYGFLWNLFGYWRRAVGEKRKQCGRVLAGFLFLHLIGPLAYLPAYKIAVPPFTFLSVIPLAVILAYTVWRYEFLTNLGFFLMKGIIREVSDVNEKTEKVE